jgi:putative ATP-dependent endonuclease of OLD family
MEVVSISIQNFRGIKSCTIPFRKNTLLICGNNVGKSTICEALDLVLGPERLNRYPVIDEHDFYGSKYIDNGEPVFITIRAIIIGLSKETERAFVGNIAFWDSSKNSLLTGDEGVEATDGEGVIKALVVEFIGHYNQAEDEFQGKTYFTYPTKVEGQELDRFGREQKRICGFLYLRTLRTGSRALSLEKGSLLDIILKLQDDDRTKMWEETLQSLRDLDPPIHKITQLQPILEGVKERMNNFIKLNNTQNNLGFYASDLTREHLREVITFFATSEFDSNLVPFNHLGTGAINTFVFALLTFIADLKGNVIFAMEEPEIALPPHTQRRITKYVMNGMDQSIFTSHSPYVLEQFPPDSVVILNRDTQGQMTGNALNLSGLKLKTYNGGLRHKFAEAILGKGVLLVEGPTEESMFPAASEVMEGTDATYSSLDLSGVSVVSADGEGSLEAYAAFFKGLGLKVYGFFDKQKQAQSKVLKTAFDHCWELDESGVEKFLCFEIDQKILLKFVKTVRKRPDFPSKISDQLPEQLTTEGIEDWALKILKARKGYGYAGILIHLCNSSQLPGKVLQCLEKISEDFPPLIFVAKKDDTHNEAN